MSSRSTGNLHGIVYAITGKDEEEESGWLTGCSLGGKFQGEVLRGTYSARRRLGLGLGKLSITQ